MDSITNNNHSNSAKAIERSTNPWAGLASYEDPNSSARKLLFCGRDDDSYDLLNLVKCNVAVTLYGKSGIGKTSLLNAGLFPELREEGYTPVYIRLGILDTSNSMDYQSIIIDSVKKSISRIEEYDVIDEQLIVNSVDYLWNFFARHKFYDCNNELTSPVIVFDQFEEVLRTNHKDADVLLKQVDYLNDKDHSLDNQYLNGILYHYEQNFRFVFSIREDDLFRLEDSINSNYLPSLKRCRYHLLPLCDEQAELIIREPVPGLVSKEVAKEIICKVTNTKTVNSELGDDVVQREIDSAILSLYLSELYEKKAPDATVISIELINDIGDNIINSFYEQTISHISSFSSDYLEHKLVTEDGVRDSLYESRAIRKGVTAEELEFLKNKHIIHSISWDGTRERIELVHDVLCPIVKNRREKRKAQEAIRIYEIEQARLRAEHERQRVLRNREYNRLMRLSNLNVLTQKGRRLLNNSFDFGEIRTINCSDSIYPFEMFLHSSAFFQLFADDMFKDNIIEGSSQKIVRDPMLSDSSYQIAFQNSEKRTCTIDGIYGISIDYSNDRISEIFFFGRNEADGKIDYETPVYLNGGFCGIHIDYDELGKEVSRTYLDRCKKPTICIDGYSIIETSYDENDNPCRIRYYTNIDGNKKPSKHVDGNYGFNSRFDESGNEIERIFVDSKNNPIKIISGVEGKRMKYDPDTCMLLEISNIDSRGNLIRDLDGYVTVKYEYNAFGQQIKEAYYDEHERPWINAENIHGNTFEYNLDTLSFRQKCIDIHNRFTENNIGIYEYEALFNKKQQLIKLVSYDKYGQKCPMSIDSNIAEQCLGYDGLGRINRFKAFDKYGHFSVGMVFDFDEKGTHVFRTWAIDHNNEFTLDQNYGDEEHDVYGLEYIPIEKNAFIVYFVNRYGQRTICSDGYYAEKRYFNESKDLTKEYYCDRNMYPMPNTNGIYGMEYIKLDKQTNKLQYLGIDLHPSEGYDGVYYKIIKESPLLQSVSHYNAKSLPVDPHSGFFSIVKEIVYIDGDTHQLTKVLNTNNELVDGRYKDETLDNQNRIIVSCWKDLQESVVQDPDGDYYTIKTYSEDGLIVTTYFEDQTGCQCSSKLGIYYSVTKYDNQERVIEEVNYDENGSPIQKQDGSYGHACEYGQNIKTLICLGKDGKPANCSLGFTYRQQRFDDKGRPISEKELTDSFELLSPSQTREYLKTGNGLLSYYIYRTDKDNRIICTDDIPIKYIEEDTYGRVVKVLYFKGEGTSSMTPVCDDDNDFGYLVSYNDDHSLTRTYLGEDGLPHINSKGYSAIKEWQDDFGRTVKQLYLSLDGSLCIVNDCFGFCFEFPSDDNEAKGFRHYIKGFLNANGEVANMPSGYAYLEVIQQSASSHTEFYYNVDKEPVIDYSDELQLGDYGKKYITESDRRISLLSLGEDGHIHTNKKGFCQQVVIFDDYGRKKFLTYLNKEGKPIPDSVGDYGTMYEYAEDGSFIKVISLNKKGNPHINDLGYTYSVNVLDVSRDYWTLWFNGKDKPVIPKRTIKGLLNGIRTTLNGRSENRLRARGLVFNARQIGAQHELIIARREANGLAKKYGLSGLYVIIKMNEWDISQGVDYSTINSIITTFEKEPKQLELLPIELDNVGSAYEFGESITVAFPRGKLGFRFVSWFVNEETYKKVLNYITIDD